MLETLYKKTTVGKVQQWQIIVSGDSYYTVSGQKDGKLVTSKPTVCKGKNIGKSNETSPPQQALAEALAKWQKQLKKNYKEDISKIEEKLFFEPMLAKKFIDYKDKISYPVGVQDKLNGIRCVITKSGAFSRKGEQFYCVDHIKESVAPLFKQFPDLVLDGELYNPIYKNQLNQIAKLVSVNRKPKDITVDDIKRSKEIVQYHVYDALNFTYKHVAFDKPLQIENKSEYSNRYHGVYRLLCDDDMNLIRPSIFPVPTAITRSLEEVLQLFNESKERGDEGIIIRILDAPYESKRSKNLMKLKNFQDEEFKVLGFKEGVGNWAGCVKMVTCKLNRPATDGRLEFDSNIRGSMEELGELWKNRKKYIGQKVTVDFQEFSEFGVPLIPYCNPMFRNFE